MRRSPQKKQLNKLTLQNRNLCHIPKGKLEASADTGTAHQCGWGNKVEIFPLLPFLLRKANVGVDEQQNC
ncbi:hypothetical protein SPOG_04999 [Schizosaccharomyces cryophilus OY26]|uniref:Uncharacterized protein n=1 Tax=Schizosaccharomyces cryophilus (strain OY26 / ATCC MYA-4695 / CBS 11777 / NBRC 106824 / NRRL Y48691) TaxID=653667 RepID=S9X8H0_SCHCR|nr:uncharacterized protein SPOG_04999 [Schizosaccharomyces cryophilus OY26]EPY50121.1 hypothetical protein SPOG_04999 [Schizosaccharomyces cryophilus OY26]